MDTQGLTAVPLHEVKAPPPVRRGDRVAILSPSAALPAVFPHVHELGLGRVRDGLGLVPVEYPTTRLLGASPEQRAADLHAAFADESVRAVMATVGGDDQITVLRHLDPAVVASNPKRFFGYSDNTNLINFLVRCGMVAYHGGSTMVHMGRACQLHPTTLASTRAALAGESFELEAADRYADHCPSWSDPAGLEVEPWSRPALPWSWHGRSEVVQGRVWGGCLEIIDWTLQVGRHAPDASYLRGAVLFVETSDEVPPADYVFRTLRNMGERGIFDEIAALLVARPAAQRVGESTDDEQVRAYVEAQREAVLRIVEQYHPGLPTVLGIDAGHTDPQTILPIGGVAWIDGVQRRVEVQY